MFWKQCLGGKTEKIANYDLTEMLEEDYDFFKTLLSFLLWIYPDKSEFVLGRN